MKDTLGKDFSLCWERISFEYTLQHIFIHIIAFRNPKRIRFFIVFIYKLFFTMIGKTEEIT